MTEKESKGLMGEYNSDAERKNKRISQLLNELYSLTDFEGVLTKSLEGNHISSGDIFQMAERYEPPVGNIDYDEKVTDIEEEEKRNILDVLENGSSDELWSLLTDYGMCSNYDYEGIKRAFEKLVEKLKK